MGGKEKRERRRGKMRGGGRRGRKRNTASKLPWFLPLFSVVRSRTMSAGIRWFYSNKTCSQLHYVTVMSRADMVHNLPSQ